MTHDAMGSLITNTRTRSGIRSIRQRLSAIIAQCRHARAIHMFACARVLRAGVIAKRAGARRRTPADKAFIMCASWSSSPTLPTMLCHCIQLHSETAVQFISVRLYSVVRLNVYISQLKYLYIYPQPSAMPCLADEKHTASAVFQAGFQM